MTNHTYKCPVYQRGFANVIGMREHKARDHDGVPPYTCQECGDKFFSGSKFSKHKKDNHPKFAKHVWQD